MPKRISNKSRDINEVAFQVVQAATSEDAEQFEEPVKNPHAVALGRLGGLKGGKARAAKLGPKKRSQIAKKAANERWAKRSN